MSLYKIKFIMEYFLDKKKINKYPRYILLKKKFNPKIREIKDFDFINLTIPTFF